MFTRHFAHWPPGQPKTLELPRETVYANLVATAARSPQRAAIDYYGSRISYAELKRQVDVLAGFLQQRFGVARGDRVLLYAQNSPQFVIAYYAILRADAVVVPVNPMNRTEELRHYIEDSDARVALAGQDVLAQLEPLGLPHCCRSSTRITSPPRAICRFRSSCARAVRGLGKRCSHPGFHPRRMSRVRRTSP